MSRIPSHVEDELQAIIKLLCLNGIVLRSKVPKESILIKYELLSKVKEESIDLPNKGKEETGELQNKLKKYPILHVKAKEDSIGLPKIENHHNENTIACINKIHKESLSKFMDFCWIAKFFVLLIVKTVTTMWQALQQHRAILRSKYHRKQQRKKFLKVHCCEPQFLTNS
jgi:heme exporter protein D